MDDFKIFDRFSYKYRLLYCLLLNYYRSYYANNKFKSKILVIGTCRRELIDNYDKLYSTIRRFNVADVLTLKRFINYTDLQLKSLFDDIDNKGIKYSTLINDIKGEYIPTKSLYRKCKYGNDSKEIPSNVNIVFMELNDADRYYTKHLIRDIFIPEYFTLNADDKDSAYKLCYVLRLFVKEITKVKETLNTNNARPTDYLSLSIFLNSDSGLSFEDEIIDQIRQGYED